MIVCSKTPKVTVMSKPVRKVIAAASYKMYQLFLLPETTTVAATSEQVPNGTVRVEAEFEQTPGVTFYLSPPTMSTDPQKRTLVAPFWLVRASSNEAESNLVLVRKPVEVGCKMQVEQRPGGSKGRANM